MGYVTAEQVMRRFSVGRSQAYLRLGTMCKRGLLRHSRLLVDQPGIYLPTRLGLELGAVQHLREPHVRLTTIIHQLTVVDAHLELADRLPDWRWRSERELAFAERRAGELIGSVDVLYYRADRRRRHRPDLLGPATGPRPGRRRGRAHTSTFTRSLTSDLDPINESHPFVRPAQAFLGWLTDPDHIPMVWGRGRSANHRFRPGGAGGRVGFQVRVVVRGPVRGAVSSQDAPRGSSARSACRRVYGAR